MKYLFAIWIVITSLSASAQLRKVESSFKKGDYADCITYCQQARPGSDREEYRKIKLYQCQSCLNLYKKTPAKFSYLDQALQIHRTERFATTPVTAEVSALLLNTVRNTSDSLHRAGNVTLAKKYVKIQASQFKDTSSLFALYNVPVVKAGKATPVVKKEILVKKVEPNRIPRTEFLRYAEQFLNIPYKWAGEDSSGFDCSGFVTKLYRHYGIPIAHGAKDQSELGLSVSRTELKPGDLVFFGKKYDTGRCKIDHVAIVHEVSDTKLIVIHSSSKGVNIQEMKAEDYWGKKILFYKNFIDHFELEETNRL